MASTAAKKKSDLPVIVMALVGIVLYVVITIVVVKVAGGTGVHADYSNTPNAVVPGPPAFK